MAPSSPAPETAPPSALRGLQYEDLRLLIEGASGQYTASVVESPAGECSAPETIRWHAPTKRLENEGDVRRVGAALFDTFLTGQVRQLYRESVVLAGAKQKGLRVKLLIDPPELCGAPWELLYDEERTRQYGGLSSKTPIIRHARIPQAVEPLVVQPPLRILGLIANPIDPNLPSLDVEKERVLIETALAEASKAGLVELQWLPGRTWEDLQQAMWQKDGWHVFHFCGHGDYDSQAGEGYLVFETAGAGPHRLAASQLGLLLKDQGDVRLAILNSCNGAVGDTSASSSSIAGALMRAGLGGVVAMQTPISDPAALTFARVTYLGIAAGPPLEAAIGSARVAMTLEHATPVEWWTPVLHMRSRDGALFDLPAPAAAADAPPIRGMEYLGREIDRRLEQGLARRRRQRRLLYSFILAPIPVLGFLAATSVQSAAIRADIEATGATFVLSAEREWFGELPRLQSFTAAGFDRLLSPGFAFPQSPPPHQDAVVTAEAVDTGSWISLQPWKLPVGARVTWDHPHSARVGEYAESLAVGANQRFHVGLVHRIRLSRFGSAPAVHDYADTSALELVSASRPLALELRFRRLTDMTVPRLSVDSLTLQRQGYGDDGPILEPTLLSAHIHFAGRDTLLETTHLGLNGLHDADMERFRLIDRGIAFSLTGSVQQITIGGRTLSFPSRLQWLIRERPVNLVVGALEYVLILLTALLSWRTSHASRPTA